MAQDMQDVFNRIRETKQEQKKIRAMYRDQLDGSHEYTQIIDELETLKARKKQIETEVKESSKNEFTRLDTLQLDIKHDNEMLSDLALNKIMAGDTVKIKDSDNNDYEPVFKVRFKKT